MFTGNLTHTGNSNVNGVCMGLGNGLSGYTGHVKYSFG